MQCLYNAVLLCCLRVAMLDTVNMHVYSAPILPSRLTDPETGYLSHIRIYMP